MTKRFAGCVAALALFALASCNKGDVFTISGTANNPGSLKKAYLMAADSSGINVVDSTAISDGGKFEFTHQAPYPNLYKIRLGSATFDVIAAKGDKLTFSASLTDEQHGYDISGSEDSKLIQEFNKISNHYVAITTQIYNEYQNKAQQLGHESDSLANIYKPSFMKNQADYSQAIIKFINENKKSLAAFFAATSLDQIRYEHELVEFADAIRGSFDNNPAVQRFIKVMDEVKPVSVGHKAPDFTVKGLDGNPIKLSDQVAKSKLLMVDFWASWCVPCRQENPNVVKQYALYHDKGLNILGVSLDNSKNDWQAAIDHDKLTWLHGSDLQKFDGPTERLYNIQAIPSNFLIDANGTIVAKNITGADLEEFLNKKFNQPQ